MRGRTQGQGTQMSTVNKWLASICASVTVLLVQVIVAQYAYNQTLRAKIDLLDTNRQLATDQIRDLMYEVDQARDRAASVGTREYITGAVAAITKPDYYDQIWHAGYSRGYDVANYAAQLDKDKTTAYTEDGGAEAAQK